MFFVFMATVTEQGRATMLKAVHAAACRAAGEVLVHDGEQQLLQALGVSLEAPGRAGSSGLVSHPSCLALLSFSESAGCNIQPT